MLVDEMEHFVLCGRDGLGQNLQSAQNEAALPQITQRKLAYHKRMNQNLSGVEQMHKGLLARAQMIDPHRRVDQYHFRLGRRRRGVVRLGSLPPKRANRRAPSRSIKALSASRTKADFSFKPVNA
jgi:hypothetical protein